MFTSNPIPGNVDLCARDFHGEPYYDIKSIDRRLEIQRLNAVDPVVFTASFHDAAAILLSPGCA